MEPRILRSSTRGPRDSGIVELPGRSRGLDPRIEHTSAAHTLLANDASGASSTALGLSTNTIDDMIHSRHGWTGDQDRMYAGAVSGTNLRNVKTRKPVTFSGTSEGSAASIYLFPPHTPLSSGGTGLSNTRFHRTRLHDNAGSALAYNRTRDKTSLQLWELVRAVLAEDMGQSGDPSLHVTDRGTDDYF